MRPRRRSTADYTKILDAATARESDKSTRTTIDGYREHLQCIAFEVKASDTVQDADVRHLHWLHQQLGDRVADAVVLYTGPYAYRRRDGIAVVPLGLLGP